MATSVGLNFRLTAAVDKFEASMKDVERRLDSIDRSSRQTAQGMKLLAALEIGKSVLSGLTGLFNIFKGGVQWVISFSSQAAAAADAIGKLSSATGMAEEPLQVFTQLASYSGVNASQFGNAVQKMSRGLGEAANGSGTASRALEALGISIDTLLRMSPEQQFATIASAIGDIEDPATKSAVAADIFGRSGTALIPMFEDFEENAKATGDEMLRLGQVLSKTQVDNIEAMNDSFERVRQTAFKIGTQVLANFAPMIEDANNALIEFVKNFQFDGEIGGQALANFLTEAFFDGAEILARWGDSFLNALSALVDRFAGAFEYVFGKQEIETPAIKKWNAEIAEYAEQIRQSNVRARKGLETQSEHERRVQALRDAIAANQEKIKEEEQRVLTKKREYATGLGSMQDSLAKARQEFVERSKDTQQRQDKVNAAFDKTLADAERAAANPAYDALRAEFEKLGTATASATDPIDLFGESNGIAGEKLRQLALDAEKFGPNADLARDALDGMKDAANNAAPAADLFGKNVGTSADELAAMARIQEDYSDNLRQAEDALDRLADSGVVSQQQLEDLAKIVAESGGIHSELGQKLMAVADSAGKLDDVQKSLQRSMMKPAEDFANQRAEMLKRMGFNPFFVESQKEKWLAQQQDAVNKQIEIQREAYEKFMERTGQGAGTAIKEALKETLDIDAEDTLPELRTQTATLGDILEAVKKQVFTQVVIP